MDSLGIAAGTRWQRAGLPESDHTLHEKTADNAALGQAQHRIPSANKLVTY
jgi:hypothetical protein